MMDDFDESRSSMASSYDNHKQSLVQNKKRITDEYDDNLEEFKMIRPENQPNKNSFRLRGARTSSDE